jgi:hypothetical protein
MQRTDPEDGEDVLLWAYGSIVEIGYHYKIRDEWITNDYNSRIQMQAGIFYYKTII